MAKLISRGRRNPKRAVSVNKLPVTGNEILDARGKMCPTPMLMVRKKLDDMGAGRVLEVSVDYPQSRDNIVRITERLGHRVLNVKEEAGTIKVYIQKAPKRESK